MKTRILIMNGQKLTEQFIDNYWETQAVEKTMCNAGAYSLDEAILAAKKNKYTGRILHIDEHHVYQTVGGKLIKHIKSDIPTLDDIAQDKYVAINYP